MLKQLSLGFIRSLLAFILTYVFNIPVRAQAGTDSVQVSLGSVKVALRNLVVSVANVHKLLVGYRKVVLEI